jgi:hypothetical protein
VKWFGFIKNWFRRKQPLPAPTVILSLTSPELIAAAEYRIAAIKAHLTRFPEHKDRKDLKEEMINNAWRLVAAGRMTKKEMITLFDGML